MQKIEIIKPQIFPINIIAGVTTKSLDSFPEFGFSINKSDTNSAFNEDNISNFRLFFANQLGVSPEKLLFQKQTHSDIVEVKDFDKSFYESDAMIIKDTGYVLNVSIADCLAILIYDPENKVIAGIHSGWRGSSKNIIEKTITTMSFEYGTKPSSLIVYISPGASGEKYEVGVEVASLFQNGITKLRNGKYLLDNKIIVLNQLLDLGVRQTNIEISDLCTISDNRLHSFRRDKERSGRMCAYIMMK